MVAQIPAIGVSDVVTLKKPYETYFRGIKLSLSCGRVEEVLDEGTLTAVKFSDYPNVCDFGVDLSATATSLLQQKPELANCTAEWLASGKVGTLQP